LPLSAQQTLSILPLDLNPVARETADASTGWRLEMWKAALPEIPKYLFRGKGYALNPREVAETDLRLQGNESWTGAFMMGDYHNGPLSVLITFGIFGALAVCWFLYASFALLYRYVKAGDPRLRCINSFLLAAFAARVVFFVFVFGSIYSDMTIFAGLLG